MINDFRMLIISWISAEVVLNDVKITTIPKQLLEIYSLRKSA